MDAAARERLLLRWAGSPLLLRRSGVHAFRKLLTFIAYADPGPPEAPNPLPGAIGYVRDDPPLPADLAADSAARQVDRSAPGPGDEPVKLTADVVVVGSGAGGGVVAAELARAGRGVLVVEAGPYVDESTMPRDELDAYGRLYLNYGLLSTWDGAITMLAGSGVGGGTLVNWMTCLDAPGGGPRRVGARARPRRPRWRRVGGRRRGDRARDRRGAVDRGARRRTRSSGAARPRSAGNPGVIRRNATDCGDCGSCPFGCRRGAKQSGIRAHLAEAVAARRASSSTGRACAR